MLWFLPPLAWTGVIAYLGGGQWGSEETAAWFAPFLHALFPGASPEFIEAVHFLVRKSAHLFEYAILALLWRRATGSSWLALVLVVLTASLDELRQLVTPGRGGSGYDVLLDGSGATVALLLLERVRSGSRRAVS
jgi:VanZ family protein